MDLRAQFEAFHASNPKVWDLFVRFTMDLIVAGHKHYSADAVLHRIRWHTNVETRKAGMSPTGEELKINNNFAAFYSRMFADRYPGNRDFFQIRKSAADEGGFQLVSETVPQ
jgi:hypothetical protein